MSDVSNSEVVARLDTIIAILQLAFQEQISRARKQIVADPINAAILDAAADAWIDAGDLKAKVAHATGQSERTVGRRIAGLIAQRAIEQAGSGPRVRYRATGLI